MNHINRTVLLIIYCFFSLKSVAQFCAGSLGSPVVNITFGSGINPGPTLPVAVPGASTTYTYSPNNALDGFYTITNAVPANSAWFTGATDHTGNPNGYMAFFNADPVPGGEFYRQTVTNLCGGTTYEFATWVASVLNSNILPNGISPNITFKILDANSGVVLATSNTGDIPNTSTMIWRQYSLLFTTPIGVNSVVLVLSNNNVGGSALPGNDLAIDDITFRPCGPLTKASFSNSNQVDSISISSCTSVDLFGSIIGSLNSPAFQWQSSIDGGNSFIDIPGANNLNYTANNLTNGLYQLQLLSAESGNLNSSACRFVSNKIKLLVTGCNVPTSNTCNNWLRIPNSQSYVTVGDLDVSGTQITVEGLFSRDSAFTPEGYTSLNVVSKHWTPADDNYLLRVDRAQITTSNGAFTTPDICETVNKRVYHVAMTYDGATLKFYRNGFLMSQTPCTGTMIQNNYPTTIAATANSPTTNTQLIGYLNEIRIWNVVKTQTQLQAAMNGPLSNPTAQSGLLGYYTFDGLTNKQGNSLYNATLHGAASINEAVPNCSLVVDSCRINLNTSVIDSIINTYTPVIAFNPCENKITVEDASTFNNGDTVLIIQMKGAEIDSTNTAAFGDIINYKNAGNYEFNYVKSRAGNIVELKNSLTRGYDVPNGKVQLIRVPYYNNVTVTNTLTCLPWDGRKGGVLVLNSSADITLNADIDVSKKGFSIGTPIVNSQHPCNQREYFYNSPANAGEKGEGISQISRQKIYGKGKLSNAGGGGNSDNAGGGGGANAGTGGNGGRQFEGCVVDTVNGGGIGGQALVNSAVLNKLYLGGGGGIGHANDNIGFFPAGKGGGIVIVIGNNLVSNGKKIIANGGDGFICPFGPNCTDGSGGGGGGGSIITSIPTFTDNCLIEAKGGKGADNSYNDPFLYPGRKLGTGGGGGGGFVLNTAVAQSPLVTVNNSGGMSGVNTAHGNDPHSATDGASGIIINSFPLRIATKQFKPNIDSTRIADTLRSCRNYTFNGKAFTNISAIQSWQWTFGDNTSGNTQNTTHTYGASGTFNVKLVVTDINGCKDSVQKQIVVPACPLSTSSIINTYTPVIRLNSCENIISVEDASTFNVGDTVLMIQMKGADIDSTNNLNFGKILNYKSAGNYEYNYIKGIVGNQIELLNIITRTYEIPTGKVQLIRVPFFQNYTVTDTLTCLPWNGKVGGVLVFNVGNTLTLNNTIDVSGRGFRGGRGKNSFSTTLNCFDNDFSYPANSIIAADKGESIYEIGFNNAFGKGPNASGGGGGLGHNSGGGGGSNGGIGGFGGYQLEACGSSPYDNRGIGGNALIYTNAANKIFMGGGGGSGHTDNAGGIDMNGGNGGGIVIINTISLINNGHKIISDGANGQKCNNALNNCHDGGGGGGAAGTVLIKTNSYNNNTTIQTIGGKGADLVIFNASIGAGRIGCGGGGGGGTVWLSQNSLPVNVTNNNTGGANGVILQDFNNAWGATPGQLGQTIFNLNLPITTVPFKKNIDSVKISITSSSCLTFNFNGLAFINTAAINTWEWNFGDNTTGVGQNVSHTFTAGNNYTVKLVVTDINGCKDSISLPVVARVCNTPQIINEYTPIVSFDKCKNSITVEDASKYNVGDTVLMIQMKGAAIDNVNSDLYGTIQNYNNAGNYEFNYISNKIGNQIELKNVLLRSYDIPTGKVQLIRVPYFNNITFTDTITCLPWDGKKGGIVVLQSANNITLNAPINVSQKGFRGGKYGNGFACNSSQWVAPAGFNGSKGEGIAYEIIGFEAGGGKQANGGGGSFAGNTGGGGGANGGSGGKGGREYDGCSSLQQSIGGQSINYALANKIFMGGGGGGGAQDNGNLILDGGKGGGIVIINTPTLTTNNQPILSNGEKINIVIQDEGGTGGGAGGSVLLFCNNYVGSVTVEANGGDGSSNNNVIFPINCHGPGGGGGGGFLGVSNATIPASITYTSNGGKAGLVLNPTSPCFNTSYFAEPGVNGTTANNIVLPLSTTPFIKTIDSIAIKDSIFNCSSVQFSGSNFPNNASIQQWDWQFGDNTIGAGQNITHTYSSTTTYTVKLKVTDINGCVDSVQKLITIGSKKFDFSIEQNVCNPLIVKYIASDTASTFKWNTGDNAVFVQGSFINHTYADTGVYLVSLTSPTGCVDTLKKSVSINLKKTNIIITPDTTICNGNNIQLQSNIDSSFQFCWSPNTYLNNANLANPTSTPNSTIKYFLRGIQRISTNLVVNGNFTNGNVNFNSDYQLSPTNPAIAAVGQYLIANSTTGTSPTANNCTDHTTGTGNMLIVKSDGIKQSKSWKQKLTIQKNTNYLFSVWIQGVEVNTKAALAFNINGITFNDSIINATTTCNWQRKSIIWNSGNSDTAVIAIENNTTPVNTLYALDEIEFYNYVVSQDSVTIKIDTPLIKSIVDTSICRGSQIVLTTIGGIKYTWSPKNGLSDSTVANPIASPSTDSTTYIVEGTNIFGCKAYDSVTVKLKPSPVIVKSNDTSICTASSIQLLVSGANKYKWSPSATLNIDSIANPIATPLGSTTYYVTSIDSNFSCVAIDSIKIDVKSVARFSVAPVDTVCVKSPVQLQAFGGNVYTWSPANLVNNPSLSNPIGTPNANTDFFVMVKDSVCKDSSLLKVRAATKPLPRLLISKSNDIDCFYFNAKLAVSGASTYTWFAAEPPLYLTDSTINTSTAFPAITKKYYITGKDTISTCSNTDSIVVFVYTSNNPEFWAPNSFTPNKDGLNECFRVFPKNRILYFELSIYNRWGQLVFKTENINGCWDGRFKGQPQDPGNFVYIIKARNECKEDFYKGNLLLIR